MPEWLPGTGFKQTARLWASQLREVTEKPYAFVKHQMSQGSNRTSFLSELLEAGDETDEDKFTNKWSAMSLYTAGADTVRTQPPSLALRRPLVLSSDACRLYPQ